jgi:hypothetical protein
LFEGKRERVGTGAAGVITATKGKKEKKRET